MSSIGVIEPYFFEEGGVTFTVNANRYCDMLENILRPKIEEYGEEQPRGLLAPTGWSYGPYSTSSARNFEGGVPGSSGLLTRGSSVATALA
jgi:hypothetical protein